MKITVHVVNTALPEPGTGPCRPAVFGTEAEAEAYTEEKMKAEWKASDMTADDGETPLPYPEDWRTAQRALLAHYDDGSWGAWEITSHEVEIGESAGLRAASLGT